MPWRLSAPRTLSPGLAKRYLSMILSEKSATPDHDGGMLFGIMGYQTRDMNDSTDQDAGAKKSWWHRRATPPP